MNTIKELAAVKYPSVSAAPEPAVEEAPESTAPTKSKKNKNKARSNGNGKVDAGPKKSAIQLARERHAATKNGAAGVNAVKIGSKGTGVNSGKIGSKKAVVEKVNGNVHPDRTVVVGL